MQIIGPPRVLAPEVYERKNAHPRMKARAEQQRVLSESDSAGPEILRRHGGKIANTITVVAGGLGLVSARRLAQHGPATRTIKGAIREAAEEGLDVIDGNVSRYDESRNKKLGSWLDEFLDKVRQNAKRLALFRNGEIGKLEFWVPLARDGFVDFARHHYRTELGIEDANTAKWPGKAKTGIMALGFVASASPLVEKHPEFVRNIHRTAAVASVASGLYTIGKLEQAYMTNQYPASVDYVPFHSHVINGVQRTFEALGEETRELAEKVDIREHVQELLDEVSLAGWAAFESVSS